METIQLNISSIINAASRPVVKKDSTKETVVISMPKKSPDSGDIQRNLQPSDNTLKNAEQSLAQLEEAIQKANEIAAMRNLKINYSVDDETKKVIVKIVDEESKEVVRQIPPEEFLRISVQIKEFQAMILDDQG